VAKIMDFLENGNMIKSRFEWKNEVRKRKTENGKQKGLCMDLIE
jgi:hypothetical protein